VLGTLSMSSLLVGSWACTGPLLLGFEDVDACSLATEPRVGDALHLRGATFWRSGAEGVARDALKDAYASLEGSGGFDWTVSSGRVANLDQFIRVEVPQTGAGSGGGGSQTTVRMALINDFDVVQLNGGADIQRFPLSVDPEATSNLLRQRSLLCSVDSGADAPTDTQGFISMAWEPSQCHGSLYAVPVGMHRINTLLFSRAAVERARAELADAVSGDPALVDPALLELARAIDKIRCYPKTDPLSGISSTSECQDSDPLARRPFASPAEFRRFLLSSRSLFPKGPMAVGSRESWPLNFFALEFLMASRPDGLYEAIWYGQKSTGAQLGGTTGGLGGACSTDAGGESGWRGVAEGDVPGLKAELDTWIDEFISYFRVTGSPFILPTPTWRDAIHAVQKGEALVSPMGDFGVMETENHDDIIAVPFPASDPWADEPFVYTPDSFAFPQREGQNGHAVRRFITEVLGDKETMLDFANKKGAIPPRSDLSAERLNLPHQREAYAQLKVWSESRSGASCGSSVLAAEHCRAGWRRCLEQEACSVEGCSALSCEGLCADHEAACSRHKGCSPGIVIQGCGEGQASCDEALAICEKERAPGSQLRVMLAVSGLAPPPGDPCVDALSEYLAVLAGGAFRVGLDLRRIPIPHCAQGYDRSASPGQGYDVCAPEATAASVYQGSRGEEVQADPVELARAALKELLVGLAQHPYQTECSTGLPP
jgi:hypothetical protein